MRLFDIVGIIAVTGWIAVVAVFVFVAFDDSFTGLSLTDGDIEIYEGTLWMNVSHAGEDVGVLREDRTRLLDGWLIETQGVVELNFLNDTHAFRFDSKTNLAEDLTLRTALGRIEAFGMTMQMDGRYRADDDGHRFDVTFNLDQSTERFTVDLDGPVHLVSHAIPRMLASDGLQPGSRIAQEFFDPLTLAPSNIVLTYRGQEELTSYGDTHQAHRFQQTFGDVTAIIHTDEQGSVLHHVMPFQFALVRVPQFMGAQEFRESNRRFDQRDDSPPAFISAIDSDFLLSLVGRLGSGQAGRLRPLNVDEEAESEPAAFVFAISGLSDHRRLHLESPRQRVITQLSDFLEIETGAENIFWNPGQRPDPSTYQATIDPEVNAALDEFIAHLAEIPRQDLSTAQIAAHLFDSCTLDEDAAPVALEDLHWPPTVDGEPDDPLQCLAFLADGLTAHGLTPHFVHGAREYDGGIAFRIWLAIYEEGYDLIEIDPIEPDGKVSRYHVQLFIDDDHDLDELFKVAEEADFIFESDQLPEPEFSTP